MPKELYEQVKDEIPKHIGVYINGVRRKNAKKQELSIDEQILKNSMIRSLCRDVDKQIKSGDSNYVDITNRQITRLNKQVKEYKEKYWELMRVGQEKYGLRWYKE